MVEVVSRGELRSVLVLCTTYFNPACTESLWLRGSSEAPLTNTTEMGSATKKTTTLKVAIQDDTCRRQAKDAYDAHQKATGSMDLLDRCKKLNDFLASVRGKL